MDGGSGSSGDSCSLVRVDGFLVVLALGDESDSWKDESEAPRLGDELSGEEGMECCIPISPCGALESFVAGVLLLTDSKTVDILVIC